MPPRRQRDTSSAIAVYVIVLLALQIFLMTVALDALQSIDPGLAWAAAGISVFLALGSLGFYRYLRR